MPAADTPSLFLLLDDGVAVGVFGSTAVVLSPSGITCFCVPAKGAASRHLTRFAPASAAPHVFSTLALRNAHVTKQAIYPCPAPREPVYPLSAPMRHVRWPTHASSDASVVVSVDGFCDLDRGAGGFEMTGRLLLPVVERTSKRALVDHVLVHRRFSAAAVPDEFAFPLAPAHHRRARGTAYVAVGLPPCRAVDDVDDDAFAIEPWVALLHSWLALPSLALRTLPASVCVLVTPSATMRALGNGSSAEAILAADGSNLCLSGDFFSHRRSGVRKEEEEERCYAVNALPRQAADGYELRAVGDVLRRLVRSPTATVAPALPVSPPAHVADARVVPGLGRFSHQTNGRTVVVFEDRTVVTLDDPDATLARVLRNDGVSVAVSFARPAGMERYLDVVHDYACLMRLSDDERLQHDAERRRMRAAVADTLAHSERLLEAFRSASIV